MGYESVYVRMVLVPLEKRLSENTPYGCTDEGWIISLIWIE